MTPVAVDTVIQTLAFIGDASMGRSTDHSPRTAWLAQRLAAEVGGSERERLAAGAVALLRWSGCTANATGFDKLLGDDVAGREALIAMDLPPSADRDAGIVPLAQIHCEVSGDIASQLGMDSLVEAGLRNIFETWRGQRIDAPSGRDVVPAVYQVNLASDLEILSRSRGLDAALATIARLADIKYPAELARCLIRNAPAWLSELEAEPPLAALAQPELASRQTALELVADVIDLKLPWLAGHSRQVAACSAATGALLGLDASAQSLLRRAGLIHAIGRVALPNHLWERPGPLTASERERAQLMPYWTHSASRRVPGLKSEAELASYAYERIDGSGYYRNLSGTALSLLQRVLATTVALTALRSPRPWRAPHDLDATTSVLRKEASAGRFDPSVVEAALAAYGGAPSRAPIKVATSLSSREVDVLRRVSLGESNKEVARSLEISPSTVRTHLESAFRKLACSTRAAATLKAFTLGLLQ